MSVPFQRVKKATRQTDWCTYGHRSSSKGGKACFTFTGAAPERKLHFVRGCVILGKVAQA